MKRIIAQVRKELTQTFRDKLTVALALVLPLILIVLIGAAISLSVKNVAVTVQDFDPPPPPPPSPPPPHSSPLPLNPPPPPPPRPPHGGEPRGDLGFRREPFISSERVLPVNRGSGRVAKSGRAGYGACDPFRLRTPARPPRDGRGAASF